MHDGRAQEAASWYVGNDRITMGNRVGVVEEAARRYMDDEAQGLTSVVVASDSRTVGDVNHAVQQARVADMNPEEIGPGLSMRGSDPSRPETAHIGDLIVTRRNDKTLRTSAGDSVLNGHRWRVTAVSKQGATVESVGRDGVPATVVLPSSYLAQHAHLGYAVIIHTSQGGTWDRAHAIIDADRTGSASAYVGATRGRRTDILIVTDGVMGRGG
ncbi:hypothetical protein [Actinomyces faecalis]|uniref:hypothetical protein n=1 Tax=Actinomyces faecalis TaxID=2722820 RepID=UPI00155370F4|nr:hypothetical protein [Actinomyces faecalis]